MGKNHVSAKLFANHVSAKMLIPKIYKDLIQFNSKQSSLKMGWGVEWTFFQWIYMDGQQVHEKLLTSGTCKPKLQWYISAHLLEWLLSKGQEITSVVRMWIKRNYCGLLGGGGYKLMQPLWKTVWIFPKKLTIELPFDQEIALLGIYSKKVK